MMSPHHAAGGTPNPLGRHKALRCKAPWGTKVRTTVWCLVKREEESEQAVPSETAQKKTHSKAKTGDTHRVPASIPPDAPKPSARSTLPAPESGSHPALLEFFLEGHRPSPPPARGFNHLAPLGSGNLPVMRVSSRAARGTDAVRAAARQLFHIAKGRPTRVPRGCPLGGGVWRGGTSPQKTNKIPSKICTE